MYDHILVPTDGSENAEPAVENGVAVAAQFGATVHALSVAPHVVARDRLRYDPVEAAERAVAAVEQQCDERGVDVSTEIRRGDPGQEILAYLEETDVDAVVMGTHGRTGLDNVLFGSVANLVVKNADVPVTTVRPSE